MIDSSRISVVISGPVLVKVKESDIDNITAKACQSVRRLLPEAEIVISTWEKTNCSGLDFDIVVFNEDPGPNINNVNRQIISRCGGIKAATREFVLAIRSESKLVNTNFLNFIDQYNLYDEKYRFLKNRVIIDNKYSTQMFHYCVSYTYSDWKSLYNSYIVREGEKLQCKRQVKELFGIYVYCPLRRIVLKSLCQKIVSRVRRTICGRKKISSP